jgi:hypothetical protein
MRQALRTSTSRCVKTIRKPFLMARKTTAYVCLEKLI